MNAKRPSGASGGTNGLVRIVMDPRAALPEFDRAWSRLVDQTPGASFLSGPVFQNALTRAFPQAARIPPIAAYRGNTLAGWLPLCRLAAPKGLRETGFPRNAHTLRNHLLTEDVAVIAAILSSWRDQTDADTLVLENLPQSETLSENLAVAARQTGLLIDSSTQGRTLDYADIPASYDAFLTTRSGQFRRQIHKRVRQLEGAGRFQIDRLSGDDLARAIPDWRSIVARSWQGKDRETAGANTAADWNLHEALTGNGCLWLARLDDQPVAALRMLEDSRSAYVHTMHFDLGLRSFAPGLVLFDAMMRDACARGLPRVDFNGTSEFFSRWATGQTAHMSIRIYRPSLRGLSARLIRTVSRSLRPAAQTTRQDDAGPETPPGQQE